MTELHCIVSGRVQGVTFRDFIRNIAIELGVNGYAKNLSDGSVEVLAQGDLQILKVLMNHIRTGPSGSRVTEIYDEWGQVTEEYSTFDAL
jgi:acylphosphatase